MHMETRPGDLLLVHVNEKPIAYARVEAMEPDVKPGWLRVRLLVLTLPLQVVTWILQPEQIDGQPFTMGGTPMRLERVMVPDEDHPGQEPPERIYEGPKGKVISLEDRKKKR